jgi:hypothetical protein
MKEHPEYKEISKRPLRQRPKKLTDVNDEVVRDSSNDTPFSLD